MPKGTDIEEPFGNDALARRLERIGDLPMARDLLARVLLGGHAMRVPWWRQRRRRPMLVATLAVLLVVVVAATPLTRGYVEELVYQMGFHQTSSGLASASGYGQTLRVKSGIDDGREVILDLHADPATPASGWSDFGDMAAQDANGHDLVAQGWQGNSAEPGGEEAVAWFARPFGGAPAGTPITLNVAALHGSGRWTMRFSVPPTSAPKELALPLSGTVEGISLTFTDVSAGSSYIAVAANLVGPNKQAITMIVGPTQLVDSNGGHIPNAHETDSDEVAGAGEVREQVEWFWPVRGSGTYTLIVGSLDGPHLIRSIAVP